MVYKMISFNKETYTTHTKMIIFWTDGTVIECVSKKLDGGKNASEFYETKVE